MLPHMKALDMVGMMLHPQGHALRNTRSGISVLTSPYFDIATREGIPSQRMIGIEEHAPLAAAMAGMLPPAYVIIHEYIILSPQPIINGIAYDRKAGKGKANMR